MTLTPPKGLRGSLLPSIDRIRGIPGLLGLRTFDVFVSMRSWSGERVGLGTSTTTTRKIGVANGSQSPKVKQLSQKAIFASGGFYQDQDIEVGPFTPPFPQYAAGNNSEIGIWDPAITSLPTDVLYRVTGPGYSDGGDWFKLVNSSTDSSFRYTFVLRKTSERP